jgi:hypothetical protein
MSEINEHQDGSAETPPTHSATSRFLWQQLPYIIVLVLAIAGVGYTNVSHQPLAGYWEFLALAIAVVCIITRWSELDNRQDRFRLVWTQAVHWIAVLITMNIMLLSGVQQLLPTPATSLVLLALLALGCFLAGLSLSSPQLCFLGVAMIGAVPVISWLKRSVLFLLLATVLVIGLGITFWTFWPGRGSGRSASRPSRL